MYFQASFLSETTPKSPQIEHQITLAFRTEPETAITLADSARTGHMTMVKDPDFSSQNGIELPIF